MKVLKAALFRFKEKSLFFGLGALGAGQLLSSFFGISLVAHSSGGVLLTAGSGYIAGTFISAAVVGLFWLLVPFVLIVGTVIFARRKLLAIFDATIAWLYRIRFSNKDRD